MQPNTTQEGLALKTGPSIRTLRKHLRVLEREMQLALSSQTECCGITLAQCHLLLEVDERGETGIMELAASLELDKSTLSRAVDGMWRTGLLNRETDPSNRRHQVISMTEKGRAKACSINAMCDQYYTRLFDSIAEAGRGMVFEGIPALAEGMKRMRKAGASPCAPVMGCDEGGHE